MRKSSPGRTVKWFAALVALTCGVAFLVKLVLSTVGGTAQSSDASQLMTNNPQIWVFTFVCIAGVALCYGRTVGYAVAAVFVSLVGYEYWSWFTTTSWIKEGANLSAIPGAHFPGNYLIGADLLDVVPFICWFTILLLFVVLGVRMIMSAVGQVEADRRILRGH